MGPSYRLADRRSLCFTNAASLQRLHPACIPTRALKPPAVPGWVHEIKQDGYRVQVRRDGDAVRLFTRRGYGWSARYPAIVAAAAKLRAASLPSMARRLSAAWMASRSSMRCTAVGPPPRPCSTPSTYWSSMARTSGPGR
jgi:hypothetical protein